MCWWRPFWHIKFLPSSITTITKMNDFSMYQNMLNWYTCVHKYLVWTNKTSAVTHVLTTWHLSSTFGDSTQTCSWGLYLQINFLSSSITPIIRINHVFIDQIMFNSNISVQQNWFWPYKTSKVTPSLMRRHLSSSFGNSSHMFQHFTHNAITSTKIYTCDALTRSSK